MQLAMFIQSAALSAALETTAPVAMLCMKTSQLHSPLCSCHVCEWMQAARFIKLKKKRLGDCEETFRFNFWDSVKFQKGKLKARVAFQLDVDKK